MGMIILKTDNGTHAPDKWARATASHIIDISATAPETKIREAREFEAKLVAILQPHHATVQDGERMGLHRKGGVHYAVELDPSPHIGDPFDEIIAASKDYSFAAHFEKPETQDYIRRVLGSHFATAMHIERMWHADTNPHIAEGQAYKAVHHPGDLTVEDA